MNEEMNNSYYGNNTQGNPNPVPQPEPGKPSGYSIASMVLGICSIVTCCLYGVPGIICGIIACIFAKKENERIQPLGYVTLSNPIRANAKETFSYFKEQGGLVQS